MFEDEDITIDVDELRADMLNNSYGAAFGGGFGGAMCEALDVESASDEELVRMALRNGANLNYPWKNS